MYSRIFLSALVMLHIYTYGAWWESTPLRVPDKSVACGLMAGACGTLGIYKLACHGVSFGAPLHLAPDILGMAACCFAYKTNNTQHQLLYLAAGAASLVYGYSSFVRRKAMFPCRVLPALSNNDAHLRGDADAQVRCVAILKPIQEYTDDFLLLLRKLHELKAQRGDSHYSNFSICPAVTYRGLPMRVRLHTLKRGGNSRHYLVPYLACGDHYLPVYPVADVVNKKVDLVSLVLEKNALYQHTERIITTIEFIADQDAASDITMFIGVLLLASDQAQNRMDKIDKEQFEQCIKSYAQRFPMCMCYEDNASELYREDMLTHAGSSIKTVIDQGLLVEKDNKIYTYIFNGTIAYNQANCAERPIYEYRYKLDEHFK